MIGLTKEQIKELIPEAETENDIKMIGDCAVGIMESLAKIISFQKNDTNLQKVINSYLSDRADERYRAIYRELKSFRDIFENYRYLVFHLQLIVENAHIYSQRIEREAELVLEQNKINEQKARLIEDYENFEKWKKEVKMAKELQPIMGKHLLSFPENCPAPFELWVKDGFNLALFNPDGEMVLVSKKEFLGILIKLHEKGKISE